MTHLSAAPLSAQDSAPTAPRYSSPPIPFSAPQLGPLVRSAPPAVPGIVVDRAVVGSPVVENPAVENPATAAPAATAQPTTVVAAQPVVNAFPQAPVSVGLASSGSARPAESASTIVERIAASSAPEAVNSLGVRRIGEDWTYPNVGPNERWMRVDLSEQTIFAYEGQRSVATFIGSTGTERYPTVTGLFRVRMKVSEQTMSGGVGSEAYSLPGVQWVMYFHSGYAFHGTYWHTNFGTPQSHGCVNLTNDNAKWLFDWAGPVWDGQTTWFPSSESNPGSLVLVHK